MKTVKSLKTGRFAHPDVRQPQKELIAGNRCDVDDVFADWLYSVGAASIVAVNGEELDHPQMPKNEGVEFAQKESSEGSDEGQRESGPGDSDPDGSAVPAESDQQNGRPWMKRG